jgi:putative FmdB family regulatory protein
MTYEYVCTECGHEWEAEQRISESALSDCPSCKRSTAKRLVTGGMGFVLKGSGWYSDLYGLKPKGGGGGGGGELGTPKSGRDSAKTESANTDGARGSDSKSSDSKSSDSKSSDSKSSETKPPTAKKDASVSAA